MKPAPMADDGPHVYNKRNGVDSYPYWAVYIGRPSKWGNPFVIGEDGTREEVVAKYELLLKRSPHLIEEIKRELGTADGQIGKPKMETEKTASLSREQIEAARVCMECNLALKEGVGDALCDLALRALSLESVREEALENAAKIAEAAATVKHSACSHEGSSGWDYSGQHVPDCPYAIAQRIRALQHAPARVAEGELEEAIKRLESKYVGEDYAGVSGEEWNAAVGDCIKELRILQASPGRGDSTVHTHSWVPNWIDHKIIDYKCYVCGAVALPPLPLSPESPAKEQPGEQNVERSKIVRTCRKCKTSWEAPVNFCPQCGGVNDEMVDRFLSWPLPVSVCADLCATKQGPGRIGTNLLSATEAKQMLEYVLAHSYKTAPPPPERP